MAPVQAHSLHQTESRTNMNMHKELTTLALDSSESAGEEQFSLQVFSQKHLPIGQILLPSSHFAELGDEHSDLNNPETHTLVGVNLDDGMHTGMPSSPTAKAADRSALKCVGDVKICWHTERKLVFSIEQAELGTTEERKLEAEAEAEAAARAAVENGEAKRKSSKTSSIMRPFAEVLYKKSPNEPSWSTILRTPTLTCLTPQWGARETTAHVSLPVDMHTDEERDPKIGTADLSLPTAVLQRSVGPRIMLQIFDETESNANTQIANFLEKTVGAAGQTLRDSISGNSRKDSGGDGSEKGKKNKQRRTSFSADSMQGGLVGSVVLDGQDVMNAASNGALQWYNVVAPRDSAADSAADGAAPAPAAVVVGRVQLKMAVYYTVSVIPVAASFNFEGGDSLSGEELLAQKEAMKKSLLTPYVRLYLGSRQVGQSGNAVWQTGPKVLAGTAPSEWSGQARWFKQLFEIPLPKLTEVAVRIPTEPTQKKKLEPVVGPLKSPTGAVVLAPL